MNAPPLPAPRARHRLAQVIVAALREPAARRILYELAWDDQAVGRWLGPGDAGEADAVIARARHASRVMSALPLRLEEEAALSDALEAAALLFDAGLFFEAHEVLEPHWRRASGPTRDALQGLIQIAVGYQHRVTGNAQGARSRLGEGSRRVRGRRLLGLSLDAFGEAVARCEGPSGATTGSTLDVPRFPRGWRREGVPAGPGPP